LPIGLGKTLAVTFLPIPAGFLRGTQNLLIFRFHFGAVQMDVIQNIPDK
jgi:hypothetical protein